MGHYVATWRTGLKYVATWHRNGPSGGSTSRWRRLWDVYELLVILVDASLLESSSSRTGLLGSISVVPFRRGALSTCCTCATCLGFALHHLLLLQCEPHQGRYEIGYSVGSLACAPPQCSAKLPFVFPRFHALLNRKCTVPNTKHVLWAQNAPAHNCGRRGEAPVRGFMCTRVLRHKCELK